MANIFSDHDRDVNMSTSQFVKVYCLEGMYFTIFSEKLRKSRFEAKGVVFVNKCSQADVVVAERYWRVTPLRRLFMQLYHRKRLKFLLWTQEPRINTFTVNKIIGKGIIPNLHVMNCYTGDIFINNYKMCRWAMQRWDRAKEIETRTPMTSRKIVALCKYVANPTTNSLKIHGKEVDLSWLRCHIALEGHKIDLVDIYGTGWPSGVSIEDSRKVDDWMQNKLDILSSYRFNLCFENTIYPYYCTEKIWNAILGGCLPIYYGSGTRIYDDFPQNSFLD